MPHQNKHKEKRTKSVTNKINTIRNFQLPSLRTEIFTPNKTSIFSNTRMKNITCSPSPFMSNNKTKRSKSVINHWKTSYKIKPESRQKMKHTMMEIFQRYQIGDEKINENELMSTDELFKKMHLMLAPGNKSNWLQYLKRDLSTRGTNFLEKIKHIEEEAEEEIRKKEKAEKVKFLEIVARERRMSAILQQRKFSIARKQSFGNKRCTIMRKAPRKGTLDITALMNKQIRDRSCSVNIKAHKSSKIVKSPNQNLDSNESSPSEVGHFKGFAIQLHSMKGDGQPAPANIFNNVAQSKSSPPAMNSTKSKKPVIVKKKRLVIEDTPEQKEKKMLIKELAKEAIKKVNSPDKNLENSQNQGLSPQSRILILILIKFSCCKSKSIKRNDECFISTRPD